MVGTLHVINAYRVAFRMCSWESQRTFPAPQSNILLLWPPPPSLEKQVSENSIEVELKMGISFNRESFKGKGTPRNIFLCPCLVRILYVSLFCGFFFYTVIISAKLVYVYEQQ